MNITEAILEGTSIAPVEQLPLRMSYDEFLAWEHEGGLTEWVDGEVWSFTPKHEHQTMVEFLFTLLNVFVQAYGLGLVRLAPYVMRSTPGGPGREPDIFFLASEHRARLTSRQLEGPADLVIEVISDESVRRDRADKFYEYQDAGVAEYWILDARPNHHRADFYVLDAQGVYQPVPIRPDGTYHSTVLDGFWLRVEWLWAEQPNPIAALREILGPEELIAVFGGAA